MNFFAGLNLSKINLQDLLELQAVVTTCELNLAQRIYTLSNNSDRASKLVEKELAMLQQKEKVSEHIANYLFLQRFQDLSAHATVFAAEHEISLCKLIELAAKHQPNNFAARGRINATLSIVRELQDLDMEDEQDRAVLAQFLHDGLEDALREDFNMVIKTNLELARDQICGIWTMANHAIYKENLPYILSMQMAYCAAILINCSQLEYEDNTNAVILLSNVAEIMHEALLALQRLPETYSAVSHSNNVLTFSKSLKAPEPATAKRSILHRMFNLF